MVIQGTGAQQKSVSIHGYGALVGAHSLWRGRVKPSWSRACKKKKGLASAIVECKPNFGNALN